MKKINLYLFAILTMLCFNGCVGALSLVATTFSAITISQEVEEEYDGDLTDYVEDKVESTYEYLEEKIMKE